MKLWFCTNDSSNVISMFILQNRKIFARHFRGKLVRMYWSNHKPVCFLLCLCAMCCLCAQCDLTASVHQLIGEVNVTVSLSQFSTLVAGSALYLTSPSLVCEAVKEGKWFEETQHLLHDITHGEEAHPHQHEADEAGRNHGHVHIHEVDHHHDHEHGGEVDHDHDHDHGHEQHQREHGHNHDHIDLYGLKVLLEMFHDHYDPTNNEVSKRLKLSQSAGLQSRFVLLVKVCTRNKIAQSK